MTYVVYINHPNNKAIIHSINSTWFIKRKRDSTHNEHWSEPIDDFETAKAFKKNTGKAMVDTCAYCT